MEELFDVPAKVNAQVPAQVTAQEDRLLEKVLESGNIEVLERFIALRKSEQERRARMDFERNFAIMRRELPVIHKTKEVKIRGTKAYSYEPIERIQADCDATIFRHGFSYSWREEAIQSGKRVWLDITGYGYTRSNYFDVPPLNPITSRDGNQVTNAVQMAGAMSTYGRRYTFISGFGLIVEGEDSDGIVVTIDNELQSDLDKIKTASDTNTMMDAYRTAYDKYKEDANKQRLVIGEYNLAKQALIKGGA